jgi:hypothetical protein
MDNPETQTILGTKHRSKRNKVNNAIQKTTKMSNTDSSNKPEVSTSVCMIKVFRVVRFRVSLCDAGIQGCQF